MEHLLLRTSARHLSTCKSPQQMFGALVKTYFAKKNGIDPADIVVVSIMPCTGEEVRGAAGPEMNATAACQDVDVRASPPASWRSMITAGAASTSRPARRAGSTDLMGAYHRRGRHLRRHRRRHGGGHPHRLLAPDGRRPLEQPGRQDRARHGGHQGSAPSPSPPRSWASWTSRWPWPTVSATPGCSWTRYASRSRKPARASTHFIEIMACPGGCVGGGGQPYGCTIADRARRGEGLYREDAGLAKRQSHENPEVQRIYKTFLKKPGLGRVSPAPAHLLLGTIGTKRLLRAGDDPQARGEARGIAHLLYSKRPGTCQGSRPFISPPATPRPTAQPGWEGGRLRIIPEP
ncbi:MAG: iron hydrogenase small subunit [Comamonadaceae bacterium]|nr:iron hydrogenase small subunit [Comamonadaceae bacterium]